MSESSTISSAGFYVITLPYSDDIRLVVTVFLTLQVLYIGVIVLLYKAQVLKFLNLLKFWLVQTYGLTKNLSKNIKKTEKVLKLSPCILFICTN